MKNLKNCWEGGAPPVDALGVSMFLPKVTSPWDNPGSTTELEIDRAVSNAITKNKKLICLRDGATAAWISFGQI